MKKAPPNTLRGRKDRYARRNSALHRVANGTAKVCSVDINKSITDWRASSQALVAVQDFGPAKDRLGSCVTSIAGPNGVA
jgi:hypothetical protein